MELSFHHRTADTSRHPIPISEPEPKPEPRAQVPAHKSKPGSFRVRTFVSYLYDRGGKGIGENLRLSSQCTVVV